MTREQIGLRCGQPLVAGSIGTPSGLKETTLKQALSACDLVEIRLDLMIGGDLEVTTSAWRHLDGIPLLFTARRIEEGGALPLSAERRAALLEISLEDAALVDIEVASIGEMKPLIGRLHDRGIPWIASFHDFGRLPKHAALVHAAHLARDAGAAAFKAAARLNSPADLARLADFQLQDHGLPVSTMGMGPLAPVSRLLCAQCGSVLNYGYLGDTATAPGQWDSALLREAIARSAPFAI